MCKATLKPYDMNLKPCNNQGEKIEFDCRVGQTRHVANGSQPPRRFSVAQVLSRGDGPRHSLHASAYHREHSKDFFYLVIKLNCRFHYKDRMDRHIVEGR